MELEVLLWICLVKGLYFWFLKKNLFSTFFRRHFFGGQNFSSCFQWDFLIHSSVNNHRNPIRLYIFKIEAILFCESPKNISNFLKNKILTSGQKHRERIGNAFPKHPKTSKTDQNSRSYPKKS